MSRTYYKLSALREVAKTRPPGYLKTIMARGEVVGDRLYITRRHHVRLRYRYSPRGWGDKVALILSPIARFIDRWFGTHLFDCKACKKRQEKLNVVHPIPEADTPCGCGNTSQKKP